ncbi:uncharacterized protein LOC120682730 isoform X2 [Panicum virgatum]|uniref:uncharacterized protein LOC120682730 isoform X2 n=1 Tax=Panicum virgatum TaxID=38727 RepID=UPI0019D57F8D|nr:uncharacterized protein LOC120682730 isoform X2 [Panicum virgatum]
MTSTLIARKLYSTLKGQPNLKVRIIMNMVEKIFGYKINYGKAWRAKQRAWKMIYGDWEVGYEKFPALFNAIKAANLGMHYEYIPEPNVWKEGRYMGTLLVTISFDADNTLVPLAFALVERENKDSWGWFLRLVRIHAVGLDREVGVISDRHQDILSAVQEQIPGYAPLHHRWCTRHLAENLLRKDGNKNNLPLFEDVARMTKVQFFEEKLEELKTATDDQGRQWLRELMRERDKWTMAYDDGGVRLVAWFNERYSHAMALHSKNQLWAPKPLHHLDKAKDRARTHEVECFDHTTGKYKVTERGDTTSNGKVRPSRSYIVVLINFSCTCGRTRQYHFPCSHYVAAAQLCL